MKINKYHKFYAILMIFLLPTTKAENRNYSQQFIRCDKVASSVEARADCVTAEISTQKSRLNTAYTNLVKKLEPDDKNYLNKTQREWIMWRDDNYNFLAEHVPGSLVSTRMTSLDFLLRSVFDRADEFEMISEEIGGGQAENVMSYLGEQRKTITSRLHHARSQ
jgi:uncharacterized protein YecT (DUF1311 family)